MRRLVLLLILAAGPSAPLFAQGGPAPNAKVQAEYEAMLQQADPAKNPERHTVLAEWCRQNKWKAKAEYHDLEARRYQFAKARAALKGEPKTADLKRLFDLAVRLKLDEEQAAGRQEWLAAEMQDRRAKVKEGDTAGLKALLAWGVKNGAPGMDALAREVLALDPAHPEAHEAVGHIKDGGKWVDPWEMLVQRGGLNDPNVRREIHALIEKARKTPPRQYAKKPLEGLERIAEAGFGPYWKDPIRTGDGKGMQYLWVSPKYDPAKPSPLIVSLHGGGIGNASEHAAVSASIFSTWAADSEFVVIAPWARMHFYNSWNMKENMLDVVDGIIQTCDRMNIDRRRIYFEGASMGGAGTQRFSWVVTELAPAYCPQAGCYYNQFSAPDLTGVPYLVFHGAKDEEFRNKTLTVFLDKLKAAKADVTYVNLPDAGHQLPTQAVVPRMLEFFRKHTNTITPDLQIIRRVITELPQVKPER